MGLALHERGKLHLSKVLGLAGGAGGASNPSVCCWKGFLRLQSGGWFLAIWKFFLLCLQHLIDIAPCCTLLQGNCSEALDALLMAEESFSLASPELLAMVDNYGMLLLDTIW